MVAPITVVVQRGDKLVTSTNENYFVRDLERRQYSIGSTPSFRRIATETIEIWRNPPVSSEGRRGKPVKVAENIKCTPFDPTRGELEGGSPIGGGMPAETLVTFIDGGGVYYRVLLDQRENRS